jgi:serine/threonine protein kinase
VAAASVAPPAAAAAAASVVKPPPASNINNKRLRRTFQAPVVLRDVNVFERKHQVGEGTYGSVFVGKDKQTNEIVALKRFNTKQEENGFPITAIREVKILKELKHPNIVKLKEIVTSKGMSFFSFFCIHFSGD